MSTITSGDGDRITVSSNETSVVIEIAEAVGSFASSIWLTTDQADELFREIGRARVELSNERPQS